jgi:hypothetical protein
MIDKTTMIEGIAVQVHIADRHAGEDCIDVDGQSWCQSPQYRFLLTASYVLRRKNYGWQQGYQQPEEQGGVEKGLALAVRRSIARAGKIA